MKYLSIALLMSSCIFFLSCKKDDNTPSTPDCETNNYGVIKVSFGANNVKHGILITAVGGTAIVRDKIVAAGTTSDTIRLAPGNYNINISSLNNANQTIQDENFLNRSANQCQETNLQVTF